MCHDNSVDILWTVRGATAFLHANGLNTEAISNVLECASNCKNLAQLEASMDLNPQQYDEIQQEKVSSPFLEQRWKIPSIWMWGCSLHQHVDVSMHLLFLGVMKSVIQMVQEWTILCRRIGSFLKYAGKTLEYVQMLGLDWCKIIPYSSDKLGGWVSENHMSMGRLCCWFYASLEQLALDQTFEEPIHPFDKWNILHNRCWLEARGLDKKGLPQELQERVAKYIMQEGGSPPVLTTRGGPVTNVQLMICSFNAMICRLMSSSVTESHIKDVKWHIHIIY